MNHIPVRDDAAVGEMLIARARAMVPTLKARAAAAAANRQVPVETIEELKQAGLLLAMQPRAWGGYELGPEVVNEIQMTIAEGCMSTAWVYAVLTVEPFLIALFDPRVAEEVWGEDRLTLISGTSAGGPSNQVTAVEGGFRLSGRWRFGSGSAHAQWTFLGNCREMRPDGTAPMWRVLLPRSDYEIVDTWEVTGLRGTGSNDIVVKDCFVPRHRAILQEDLYHCTGPGQAVHTAALYRMPFGQVFAMSVSTLVLGGLKAMLDAFLTYGSKRVARGIGPTARDPVAQLLCAEVSTTIDEITGTFRRNGAALRGYAERGEIPPLQERMAYKFQLAFAVERASLLAHRLFKAAGASGIYTEGTVFGRLLADIDAGRQHVNNQYEPAGRNWGRVMLGGDEAENQDIFL